MVRGTVLGDSMQVREGTKLGQYRVVRKIGEGGMGSVFEGVHERLQKRVAIKTLHEQFACDASAVARFTREGRAASRIRHGHVIDVTDVGMEDGTPFLVMELLEGESLAALIKRHGPMGPDAIADIALPVLDALDAAHTAGIVHRDLKPENIFLTRSRSGTDAHPMVLDFGISCIEDEVRMTKTSHFMGTPHYMSPEQAQSARLVDARSDQFSFGLVLFELVTGRRALTGDSVLEVVHRVSTEGAIRLGTVRPDLPRAFTGIIDKMTERDPNQRYASLREVGAALLSFASPRGAAMWGHAFQLGGVTNNALRSSIPVLHSQPPAMPSLSSPSIQVSVPSSFRTHDAPPRASFSQSVPGGRLPSTRPASFNAPAPSFNTPGKPHPVLTPSYAPRSSGTPGQSRLATDPTVDAAMIRTSRTSEPMRAKPRSPVLLVIIAVACVIGAVGIAFVVGTTLAHQQQGQPLAVAPPPSVAIDAATTTTTVAPLPTTIAVPTTPIDIRLRAVPASSEIVLDGITVGTGTYSGTVARDGIPHLLEVRADGFIPHDIQFLDIAPIATITLDRVPSHHRGPVVAQHSQMTSTGLVEATEAPPPTLVQMNPPSTDAPPGSGVMPPTTGVMIVAPGGTMAPASTVTGGGQAAGSGSTAVGNASPPTTTLAEPTPPPTSTAPPPPSHSRDDWDDSPSDDDLVPFQ